MKTAYMKPTMTIEGFQANEYVAACFTVDCIGNTTYYTQDSGRNGIPHQCDGDLTWFNGVYGQGGQNVTTTGDSAYLVTSTAEGSFWADINNAENGGDYFEIFLKVIFGLYRNSTDEVFIHNGHVSQTKTLSSNGASASV